MALISNVVKGSASNRLALLVHGYGADERDLGGLLPYLDPDGPGGVRMVKTDLHPGRIVLRQDLWVALETVTSHLDSLSELSEVLQLRLQMAMERWQRAMSTLSNLLKKVSETSSAIIQNLK